MDLERALNTEVKHKDLGLVEYNECWAFQQKVFDSLLHNSKGVQTLILCEHPHTYTLGKSGMQENLLVDDEFLNKIGAKFYKIDRGGDITYHGPGQLVGYPILDLQRFGIGLREYINRLEESVIATLAMWGINGGRSEGATGVWLNPDGRKPARKICAIGVRSSRYVTMHGFALNVGTDLRYFSYINPCGFTDRGVTSMEAELGHTVKMEDVKGEFVKRFGEQFGF
jgi:lipoyl(octanoyl) transferase